MSTHVLPAKSERALNKFLTEYDWDEDQLNKECLELLQQSDDTRWSSEDVVIVDDTFTHKTSEKIPNVGKFYDHTIPGYIWGQNLIYALYAYEQALEAIEAEGMDARTEVRDRATMYILSYTGVRVSEMFRDPRDDHRTGIRWADVELKDDCIQVLGKNQSREHVPPPEQAHPAIERWKQVLDPPT